MSNTFRYESRAVLGGVQVLVDGGCTTALPAPEAFYEHIKQEFCQGSAISPSLFQAAVRTVADTEILPGGEVAYPINEALNWPLTRFGREARPTLHAALLENEDGSCWQAKLDLPRREIKRDQHGNPKLDDQGQLIVKTIKYESPRGASSRPYLPPVNREIRRKISVRYGVEVPPPRESFWDWLADHPEIPITFTEGGKKALCLLSQGYVAIALYGVNGGYRKLLNDSRELIPDLTRFAVPGRRVYLAFDKDAKPGTQKKVTVALLRFGALLSAAGCIVLIAEWQPEQGKGVDDLIVQAGAATWERAYTEALPLDLWQIWQGLKRQLSWKPAIRVNTADLSTFNLQQIPAKGIIALRSPKGTGKTKWIGKQVKGQKKVLSVGHRRSLQRSLSQRLNLDYISDLDKVNGDFISGHNYTHRVSLVVDSLLAIDPEKFRGCVLVLDEGVQVVRHLLTSSTCAKDGKRPALLARFRQLFQVAERVIVADADLDSATLHYLRTLKGEATPVFLIRNDYQPPGYTVRMIECTDRTAITADLLTDITTLESGKVLFVATDSKATSKALARTIEQQFTGLRVLVINSETSGGELERAFIQNPDVVLKRGDFDIIICSPSLSTGVSIEAQGTIAKVYGIFGGVSSTDADMAQALGRVREPVERVVWCAKRGSNFSKVSPSTYLPELKAYLKNRTCATISLIRSSLREDIPGLTTFDWDSNPHLNLYCRIAAGQNRSMLALRDTLIVRLQFEGNLVSIENRESSGSIGKLLKVARDELRQLDAENIVVADDLTVVEVVHLETQESISPEQQRAIAKFYLKEFYCLDYLTVEDVLADKEGRRRKGLRSLEELLHPDLATDRTIKSLNNPCKCNQSQSPWDVSSAALEREVREKLGLADFLDPNKEWTKYDIHAFACKARQHAALIKQALNFTITDKISDVQILHQLLSQLNLKIEFYWSRSVPGHEGEKLRVYRLHRDSWKEAMAILEKREAQRDKVAAGSPPSVYLKNLGGDPNKALSQTSDRNPVLGVLPSVSQASQGDVSIAIQVERMSIISFEETRKAMAS